MIPHKEELVFFENLAKGQHQLFGDSADYGRYITVAQLNAIKRKLRALKRFYGGRNWSCNSYKLKQGKVSGIRIPFEVEGERARGAELSVLVGQKRPGNKFYTSINIKHFDLDVSDIPALNR